MSSGPAPLRVGVPLSLTGRYARFGRQAATGVRVWSQWDGHADVVIEDDGSDRERAASIVTDLIGKVDLLLGPYSTGLTRAAARVACESHHLLWNHGGSGDDAEGLCPGHVISILTPTSKYATPLLRHLAALGHRDPVWILASKGRFSTQVQKGAVALADQLSIPTVSVPSLEHLNSGALPEKWNLFCCGNFEQDVEAINRIVRFGDRRPIVASAVAAGVSDFRDAVEEPDGVFGVAQWFPRQGVPHALGMSEEAFVTAYRNESDRTPDYPAVQAVAASVIASHCARMTDSTEVKTLWDYASHLDTSTLYGNFRIDPKTGVQVKHEMALVRWQGSTLTLQK
ncbi:MAG: ABC transporter substrate-binding protein [Candidatus Dormibacteraceae bacterium]